MKLGYYNILSSHNSSISEHMYHRFGIVVNLLKKEVFLMFRSVETSTGKTDK